MLWRVSAVELLAMPVAIVMLCVIATAITLTNDSRKRRKQEKRDKEAAVKKEKRKGILAIDRTRTPLNSPATTCSQKRKGQVV